MLALVVIRGADLAASERFYAALGLAFTRERHGTGPEHLAAVLPGGAVFEVYPRGEEPGTERVRLGFRVPSVAAALEIIEAANGVVITPPRAGGRLGRAGRGRGPGRAPGGTRGGCGIVGTPTVREGLPARRRAA